MKKKILLALLIAFTAYLGSMTADIQAKDLISTNTNQENIIKDKFPLKGGE